MPITWKLGERVIENSVSKLVRCMRQAVQYMGFPLDDYGKFVAYICAQNYGTPGHNKVNSFQGTGAEKHLSTSLSSLDMFVLDNGKACLAPNDGKPFAENLIGSRIKVWWQKNMRKSYEGDTVSYDPIEKKHKVRYANGDEKLLLLEKEQWEFVSDESDASGYRGLYDQESLVVNIKGGPQNSILRHSHRPLKQ
ncbi:hypothetical protein RCOM_0621630 [Ricinus communis]|uniref:Uncharacterized protein n=1 Tax=Ricinus communis TaxID=3988 RepID=B9SHU6_RICCO|nr:hypothetical protein RCOM_0621630 [Ricinus communis]